MSAKDNVALVKGMYEAFARGDIPAVLEGLAPDVDWTYYGPDTVPHIGRYQGREAVLGFIGRLAEHNDILAFEPRAFLGGDGHVVVLGREKLRAKATGRTCYPNWCHVHIIRDGRVAEVHEYADTAEMVPAYV